MEEINQNLDQINRTQSIDNQIQETDIQNPSKEKIILQQKSKSKLPILIILAILLIVLFFVKFWLDYQRKKSEELKIQTTIQTTPAPETKTEKTDETTDWQIYNNTKYKYQVKYPKKLSIAINCLQGEEPLETSPSIIITENINDPASISSVFIQILNKNILTSLKSLESEANLNFENNLNQNKSPNNSFELVDNIRESVFKEIKSYEFVIQTNSLATPYCLSSVELNNYKAIWLENNNYYYIIYLPSKDNLFDQILSTFKFIDQEQTDETTNWETFTSPYGDYTFKHPTDLQSDNGAAGTDQESIRFTYVEESQTRKQGMLSDGYAFVVTKIKPYNSAINQAQRERSI
ncbi:hypothetical protein GYA19_02280 [Candidatus Beckwithbacteria bacterium]|nr:hypothetical protein [Candidatus Beckwithbacteria bacterium]